MSLFKSYLRQLLVEIQDLKRAIEENDQKRVNEIITRLIKNIEDGIADD